MDKDWKLQRYHRKDYSDVVDFPVEIVGRDGVVRRYSFEDSIRLYQRRITFAPSRYRDSELVQAEVSHCRSRIGQLRRSYFHRFGWGTPEGEDSVEFGDLAGELAAFICRVLHCEGRPEVHFERVTGESDGITTWYVTPLSARSGMLLYVHRFEGEHADSVRDVFFATLKTLERSGRVEGDGERLLAFHHTNDCGLVLTGRGGEHLHLLSVSESPVDDHSPTPWDETVDVIRRGDYEIALTRCRALVREQPWHRNGYAAGAMLASHLGQDVMAEELALLGSRYYPDDGLMAYLHGVALLRQHRLGEALARFGHAYQRRPQLAIAAVLWASTLAQLGRHSEARAVSQRHVPGSDERRAERELVRLRWWLSWRQRGLGVGLVIALVGLVVAGWMPVPGAILAVSGGVTAGAARHAFRRYLDRLPDQLRMDDVSHGLRRVQQRPPALPRVV